MIEHKINKLDNFIMGWYQEDHTILDKITDFFNKGNTTPGKVYGSDGLAVEKSVKDSLDLYLEPGSDLFYEYASSYLQLCTDQYISKYPMANKQAPWSIISNINIQQYPPNGGFHKWHTERFEGTGAIGATHLVFMTYLNDVSDGGETEFMHQNIKVKPQKGLTLIWPADWTFTHRGVASPIETKTIVTGWYHFTQ
jgi:hypothetical protein